MDECKHGMKTGCAYCHARTSKPVQQASQSKRQPRPTRLSEKMNDRMTALKQRLKEIRGE